MLPNITEASLPDRHRVSENTVKEYICGHQWMGFTGWAPAPWVLTGVFDAHSTGVLVSEQGKQTYYRHELLDRGCHGTGDVYASSFVGAYMHGKTVPEAARTAAELYPGLHQKHPGRPGPLVRCEVRAGAGGTG